ncbi:MAG: Hsp20/alpha crystallin family protein [Alkalicoccus sp.]|nr:MAG: Hsp20/alpha crystallin family protein [Alkalicoccus sp.]
MANLFPKKRQTDRMSFPSLFEGSQLDDLFDFSFKNTFPKVDVKEKNNHYEIKADLPGFDKNQVIVEYEDGYLTIKGEQEHSSETKDENDHFVRKERTYGSFQRSFYVGEIDENDIKGKFKNGLLTLEVPKSEEDEHKHQGKRISLD